MFNLETFTNNEIIKTASSNIIEISSFNTFIIISFLIFNIIMFFSSKYIFCFLYQDEGETKSKIRISKIFNVVIPILVFVDIIFRTFIENYHNIVLHIIYSSLTVYILLFLIAFISFFIRKEFGYVKEIDGKDVHLENYSSRIFTTLSVILIIMVEGYILIKIWNLNSLLSDTGIIYIGAAFITITHSIWAPDFYYGFLMLKSDSYNDGDVIKFKGEEKQEYLIDKIMFNYTLLSNVRDNHKTTIRNSKLFDKEVETLNRLSYMDGLRFSFTYKIGYPNFSEDKREIEVTKFITKIHNMFKEAHEKASSVKDSHINDSKFDIVFKEAGDFALEFQFIFFVRGLKSTKLTKIAREYLVKTPSMMNEEIYKMSVIKRVDLSTPNITYISNLNSTFNPKINN